MTLDEELEQFTKTAAAMKAEAQSLLTADSVDPERIEVLKSTMATFNGLWEEFQKRYRIEKSKLN